MNSGILMAIIAVVLQLADRPEPSKEMAIELAKEYIPDSVYVGAAVINETLIYSGGATWQTGDRYGLGIEYRYSDNDITFIGIPHKLVTHTGGIYLYRDLATIGGLSIRTDIGAGIILPTSKTIAIDETWVLSARAVGLINLTDNIDLMMYFAGVQVGPFTAMDSQHRATIKPIAYPETGINLRVEF